MSGTTNLETLKVTLLAEANRYKQEMAGALALARQFAATVERDLGSALRLQKQLTTQAASVTGVSAAQLGALTKATKAQTDAILKQAAAHKALASATAASTAADLRAASASSNRLLPLSELAKLLPCVRGNKPPSRTTLYRWATVGLKSRSGQRIRLEVQFVGGTLCASLEDVDRLNRSMNDIEYVQTDYRSHREQQQMTKRAEAARARLRAAGFLKPISQAS